MKLIKMNNDKYFDVDLSLAEAQIDSTNPFSKKELPSINLLNNLLSSKVEMKNHNRTTQTGNLCIEYEIDVQGNGFKIQSGLSTTHADYYFLNIDEMGLFLPVEFLKFIYSNREKFEIKTEPSKESKKYIGHSLLIPMYRLQELYNNYYNFKISLRLKKLAPIKKV